MSNGELTAQARERGDLAAEVPHTEAADQIARVLITFVTAHMASERYDTACFAV